MKNFAGTIPEEHRHRNRFRTSHAELFAAAADERSDQLGQELDQAQRETQINRILQELDVREREIIVQRFGLAHGREALTLKQVGANLGVTKERIRQIEVRALNKLRRAAEMERAELSGLA